ncbi:hypothetical protein LG52_1 [Geobacillus kaustophilus]|uniref:Uncharacterized protein n=1 Tax=Geobacillus kaustophilus TaxID=1462 RepID=A0A0D8BXT4_GEOKU|nr:hypothetical protein LG52_1 [Geobacillus kaustophilus]
MLTITTQRRKKSLSHYSQVEKTEENNSLLTVEQLTFYSKRALLTSKNELQKPSLEEKNGSRKK